MTPQTVNAVNLPAMNALNFPGGDPAAAVLRPERRRGGRTTAQSAPSSATRSATASTTRARSSMRDGQLHDWWTPEDFAHFKAAAERLVAQYDALPAVPRPRGQRPADAQREHRRRRGTRRRRSTPIACRSARQARAEREGFTRDQRFFLSFAQARREKRREAAKRQRIVTDGHAPAEYRADTVRNLDAWYDTFAVKPGQKLYLAPGDRVRVW